ncbi:MAG: RNA-directed polymerase (Reverse transcriptase) [Candidatus Brocadiaceae bacterium]|nr:RNA-directed polymerase (Reverse transcriptase) [Candidatus Brocadiaceae bacterium]
MKRHNNLFGKIVSFENVLKATRKARKGKRYKASTARFEYDLERNVLKIIDVLKNKTYKPGAYQDFYVYDPKKRLISAAPYFDRVIHHAVINVIGPILESSFISDTYACIHGKGTHKAVQRYKEFQKKNAFVLKCDIKRYYENIDHKILFNKLENKIKCRETLWLLETIINSRHSVTDPVYFPGDNLFTPLNRKKGIPIGNLTSQFFANLYLNDFDHFMKEEIKAGFYVRYCDDFVIFGNSKTWLNEVKIRIIAYLKTLRLRLHENKSRIYMTSDGVDFLGYRIYPDYLRVRKSTVKKYRKKLRGIVHGYETGVIQLTDVRSSIHSWIGHVKHANSYALRKEMLRHVVLCKRRP